jgi:hypothetical protein
MRLRESTNYQSTLCSLTLGVSLCNDDKSWMFVHRCTMLETIYRQYAVHLQGPTDDIIAIGSGLICLNHEITGGRWRRRAIVQVGQNEQQMFKLVSCVAAVEDAHSPSAWQESSSERVSRSSSCSPEVQYAPITTTTRHVLPIGGGPHWQ